MMAKLYKEMTHEELQQEMKRLQDEGQQALTEQRYEELDVLERKYYLALSYTMDPASVTINKVYKIVDSDDRLQITRMDGVMSWGYRNGVPIEEAYPMAMLVDPEQQA
jgi:hypothetical protein